jgi:hypothetical protein
MKYGKGTALLLIMASVLWGCSNTDTKAGKFDPDKLYFFYSIVSEEGAADVVCLFQYKTGGAEGKGVNVAPGRVELDGEALAPDSAGVSGIYYEAQRPADSFGGRHSIKFTAANGKQYVEDFEFTPFALAGELPDKISRAPFALKLNNFPKRQTPLRLLLLDTSFASRGFNDVVPVVNSEITIDEAIWQRLKNGPINLELYREQEIPLKQPAKAGGKISITYGLKREFELVD